MKKLIIPLALAFGFLLVAGIVLLVVLKAGLFSIAEDSGIGFAGGGRTGGTREHDAGGLFGFLPGSNCNSYYGADKGDCWTEKETYTYGSATAVATARMSVLNPLSTTAGTSYRAPNYTYNGKKVYVGNIDIQYFCDGDKQYIRPYDNLGWYSCTENGCSGTETAKSGVYTLAAPQAHIPQIRFQCFDYTKKTASNGDWAFAWVWAGIVYYTDNSIQLVTTIPDTDGDGVRDNVDKCHASATPVGADGCYKAPPRPEPAQLAPPSLGDILGSILDWIASAFQKLLPFSIAGEQQLTAGQAAIFHINLSAPHPLLADSSQGVYMQRWCDAALIDKASKVIQETGFAACGDTYVASPTFTLPVGKFQDYAVIAIMVETRQDWNGTAWNVAYDRQVIQKESLTVTDRILQEPGATTIPGKLQDFLAGIWSWIKGLFGG